MAGEGAAAATETTTTEKPEGGQQTAAKDKGGTQQQQLSIPDTDGAATGGTSNGKSSKGEPDDGGELELGIHEKNGKKFISMEYGKFKEKIEKTSRKLLKEIFGTGDKKAVLAVKKQFDDFQKEAENRKKEEMTERQRLEAERDEALTARQAAERRADKARDYVDRHKVQKRVVSQAAVHIAPDMMDDALLRFRNYLGDLPRKKLDRLQRHPEEWGKWFEDLAKSRPVYAKKNGETATETSETRGEPKPEKKKASNGIAPKDKPTERRAEGGGSGGKTTKQMTPSELRDYAHQQGVKLPSDLRLI